MVRDEAEQFEADPGTAFRLSPVTLARITSGMDQSMHIPRRIRRVPSRRRFPASSSSWARPNTFSAGTAAACAADADGTSHCCAARFCTSTTLWAFRISIALAASVSATRTVRIAPPDSTVRP
jgi:hypothetical protein